MGTEKEYQTIIDYLRVENKLFKEFKFNELDALVFAKLAYYHFDVFFENPKKGKIKLIECFDNVKMPSLLKRITVSEKDFQFFSLVCGCNRYKNVLIRFPIESDDLKADEQFSATTFILPTGENIIAFRGTDTTLHGWREDINMATICPVPSQLQSKKYLGFVAKKLNGDLITVGHSKGGNLAQYSVITSDEKIQNRVKEIYDFDGPFFDVNYLKGYNVHLIQEKVHKFVPVESIVGLIFDDASNTKVVKANSIQFKQHDLLRWAVDPQYNTFNFSTKNELKNLSSMNVINKWLDDVTPEVRGDFTDLFYEVLVNPEFKDIRDVFSFKGLQVFTKHYASLEESRKKNLNESIKNLVKLMFENRK